MLFESSIVEFLFQEKFKDFHTVWIRFKLRIWIRSNPSYLARNSNSLIAMSNILTLTIHLYLFPNRFAFPTVSGADPDPP